MIRQMPADCPTEFETELVLPRHFALRQQLARFAFSMVTEPRYLVVFGGVFVLGLAGIVMLAAGGPLPWYWCIAWIAGSLWVLIPIARRVRAWVVTARKQFRDGDVAKATYGSDSLWVVVPTGGWRLRYASTTYAGSLWGFAFFRTNANPWDHGVPVSLIPVDGIDLKEKFKGR